MMGLAIPLTLKTRKPLVKLLLFNEQIIDIPRVNAALAARNAQPQFDAVLRRVSWILAISFMVSGVVNFVMARWIVKAVSGTAEFNDQVGKLHLIEWPVITIPFVGVMMWCLFGVFFKSITALTGLTQDEVMRQPPVKEKNPQPWNR